MGVFQSLVEVAANSAVKMLSHLPGPVALDFEPNEEKSVVYKHFSDNIPLPEIPYNDLPKQGVKKIGFLDSFFDIAGDQAVKMLSHSLGPVPLDFEVKEKLPSSYYDNIKIPEPPYSHFSEQDKLDLFERWIIKNQKVYLNEKQKLRKYEVFKQSMGLVERVCAHSRSKICCIGLTGNSDLTDREYSKKMGLPTVPDHFYKK